MPPRQYSRHQFCSAQQDSDGSVFLSERIPYRYRYISDAIIHIVKEGDTLWTLADTYYHPLPRAAGLWWVIADFQPYPIFDPTIKLANGSTIIVPPMRIVVEEIFGPERRSEEPV